MDATTAEAVRVLGELARLAAVDPEAVLADVDVFANHGDVFRVAMRALRASGFYAYKTCRARVKAVGRAIATLEAQP